MTGIRAGITPESVTAAVPASAVEHPVPLLGRHCIRCGAVGTHYLTCPGLQLPAGYRLSEDPEPKCRCGLPAGSCGGPDHPDWPWPPRH